MSVAMAKALPDFLSFLGKDLSVTIDRPLGSTHPRHASITYTLNYGFVPGTMTLDGCEVDAYLVGLDAPLKTGRGRCVAVIERFDDVECKLVVAADGLARTRDEIAALTQFQEQYFETQIHLCPEGVR